MFSFFGSSKVEESSPGNEFLSLIPGFHAAHLWRFVIDGNRQNEGPYAFDIGQKGEPGYLMEMLKSFDYIAKTKNEPLTSDYIETLHDLCIEKVKENIEAHNRRYKEMQSRHHKGDEVVDIEPFKSEPMLNIRHNIRVNFGVLCIYPCGEILKEKIEQTANLSAEGFPEITAFINNVNYKYGPILSLREVDTKTEETKTIDLDQIQFEDIQKLITNGKKIIVSSGEVDKEIIKKIITELIEDYQNEMKNADHPLSKLKQIAALIQKLVVLHPFTDGNSRTFSVLLLNKLLLENNLTPVILTNPNRFEGFSNDELINEIIHGQDQYTSYVNYQGCEDIIKGVHRLLEDNPYFNKTKINKLNILLENNASELTTLEHLNLIEHIYRHLISSKPKNYETYLPLIKNMYENELINLSGIYSSYDLRKVKRELHSHHLAKGFQEKIKALTPVEGATKKIF